jgi:hypothetical protein
MATRGEDRGQGLVRWLVLDSGGQVAATLRLPASTWLIEVGRETVVGVEHDDFDVPYAVRYRVERRPEGSASLGAKRGERAI